MDWAEDLKQTLKKTVKKGRRALESTTAGNASSDSPSTPDYELNLQENPIPDEISPSVDFKAIPLKSKHRAGWTDEPVRSASGGKSRSKPTQSEMERFNTVLATSPRSDDIPELPDLEDILDETALDEAIDAQAIVANRVETYKELNSELLKYSEFSSSENIDLSKLMQCLQDESILTDHDVVLTKEQLFSEVASLIYSQKDSAEDNIKSPE